MEGPAEVSETDISSVEAAFAGFSTDYPEALVRIASLRAEKQQYLLFGWAEFYPFDMTAPSGWKAGKKPWTVPGLPGWTLGFSTERVSSSDALRWYVKAASGGVNIALTAPKPVLAKAPALAREPNWGRFSTAVDAPFAMRWHDGPRIHRLVPMERPAGPIWKLRANVEARAWLQDNLGFDPFTREEWLCGLALLATDPVCASCRVFPSSRTNAGETLSLHLVPRRTCARTADLTSLTVHVVERRSEAWTSIASIPVTKDGFATYQSPQLTDRVGWAVVCKERGLLRIHEPNSWVGQINIGMAVNSGTKQVEVPSGGRRKPPQTYETPILSPVQTSVVGGPVDDRARKRLRRLLIQRRVREQREEAAQRLFGLLPSSNSSAPSEIETARKEAQDYIVDLVRRARRRLIFVDPFFGPREVRLFGLQNPHGDVTPRILTGLLGLRTLSVGVQGFQVQQGLQLIADLKGLETQLGRRTPVVRIMPGQDQSIIHDRYLVIDDEVWHCGPSFNELGERLGLIIKVPNPMQIRLMIARVWLASQPLSQGSPPSAEEEA
ncbi:VPA1262 family N-terminal domain-containing protein [Mesorhizobium sp. LSJC269B00]|uniref:VPA1262 family N-terminal domain-containing protein n=1 Tax=Mesorhizobium sp. LSJC269B00 TaxID=1287326 RepID=UPI0004042888|nr:VPA1262 family N-terminal domain-containing protein [Mesorhizobium sp. LSJC269B00]